mgnify:FL=1
MQKRERVLLVGCQTADTDDRSFALSMEELAQLVKTAGGTVVHTVTQKRFKIEPATYIGAGKIAEIASIIEEKAVDTLIFNDELTASQARNIYERTNAAVIDRTQLILDIFAQRAQSREGKLQVELAQLTYLLPRLTGQGLVLSRLGGGIGTRGPGETKLETDRRHIRRRMDEIKRQLDVIVEHRQRYRERRKQNDVVQLALIGYTNAGKSTLLNKLAQSDAVSEDKLFATLDPMTRKMTLPSGMTVLLSDTVGFIQQLPTTLIAAFRSTLEELTHADLLLHVVDSSNPHYVEHEQTVQSLIAELEASDIPQLVIYNKIDAKDANFFPLANERTIEISARCDDDIERLKKAIEDCLSEQFAAYHSYVRGDEGHLLARCRTETIVRSLKWNEAIDAYEICGFVKKQSSIGNILLSRIAKEKDDSHDRTKK